MFKVGDYVTRNSYNNDIIFKIIDIKDDVFYLKGIYVRLSADSYEDDLRICNSSLYGDNFDPSLDEYRDLNRNEYFYLPGVILHIDGDKDYLDKCMSFYKKLNIKAYGFYVPETDMESEVTNLLKKYNPDILVLTGHDSFSRNKRSKYQNTSNFVSSVKEARKYIKEHDKLFLVPVNQIMKN